MGGRVSTSVSCVGIYLFQPHLLETILSPLNGLGTFVENQLAMNVWVYLWTLNSIPDVHIFLKIYFECNKISPWV